MRSGALPSLPGPGAGGGGGGIPVPRGTAELQVREDLPADDVTDEEAEVLRVPEAGGRVVQQRPGGFVQGRPQRAPSLPPSRGSVRAGRGLSPGEPAALGRGGEGGGDGDGGRG